MYTHVSPFGYSIVTTDSIISVSLDNYLGSDYKGYEGVFYKYQLAKRERVRIVPDIFKGWLYTRYNNWSKSLVEGMIYEGAIVYAIEYIIDDYKYWEIIGYDTEKQKWCNDNEKEIWNAIIRLNHLYSNDNIIYTKYMNDNIKQADYDKIENLISENAPRQVHGSLMSNVISLLE